jgi:glycosyltransferase involved in cell wall biosynthesis
VRLLTVGNCPLDPNQGSGYVMLGYVERLRTRGWHVDALGADEIDPWPALGRARGARIAIGMATAVRRALGRRDYDVVELYGGEGWLAIARLVRRRDRKFLLVGRSNGLEPAASEALVSWLGSDTLDGRPRRWWQRDGVEAAARGFRAADALVTVSEREREYAIAAAYQPADRVLAIDNPLPDDWLGLPFTAERPATIQYVGSWLPRKGTAAIAAALPAVLDAFPAARLRLVGVGAGWRVTEHFPAHLHGRIEVVPFLVDRTELRAAYSSAAIAVVPSVYESFGLAAAEAMACGCAVVASRTGFAAGLRDGVEARLFHPPGAPQLEAALRDLLADEARRRAIAHGGYQRVQSLRWEPATDALEQAYRRWLHSRRGG